VCLPRPPELSAQMFFPPMEALKQYCARCSVTLRLQLLQVCSDLVAFDAPAAGSRGFYSPGGSRIFHARRSSSPGELGVSVVADLVVSAGLGSASSAPYSHTAAFRHFHW
jgi:hypothetical protein